MLPGFNAKVFSDAFQKVTVVKSGRIYKKKHVTRPYRVKLHDEFYLVFAYSDEDAINQAELLYAQTFDFLETKKSLGQKDKPRIRLKKPKAYVVNVDDAIGRKLREMESLKRRRNEESLLLLLAEVA